MVDRTDEEQIEALKAWWRENGMAVIFGIVLGIGVLGGWRMWDAHQENRAIEASAIYQKMQTALREDQSEAVQKHGQQLLEDYAGTPYASFAALALARQAVRNDDLATAEEQLRQALDQADDPSIRHVARLRLIQVLIARDELDAALNLIESTDFGRFTARYEELRGDILVAQGRSDAAHEAYSVALANTPPEANGRDLLTDKLEILAPIRDDAE